MIHLNLDPTPVPAGEIVALTPEASIVSLGEIRLTGGRRYQVRRTTAVATGRAHEYLVDARGNGFVVDPPSRDGIRLAYSRNTGRPLTQNAAPVRLRLVGDRLVLA